jgi:hypothetical protein
MAELSPAAQAVINATAEQVLADRRIRMEHIAAAAIRAAASVLRNAYANEEYVDSADDFLDDIAAELEGKQ